MGNQIQITITQAEYGLFQQAFNFFNAELFDNQLPQPLITLQRRKRARGHFSPERFLSRTTKEEITHELALNPDEFERTDKEILSTLVHEMVHLWQFAYGKYPRTSYHDKQWGAKMLEIGLHPSATGQPGGKMVGKQMTHYIVDNGPYEVAFAKLAATGFVLNWQSRADDAAARKKKAASKTKYSCPTCSQNAWAKPGAELVCGGCYKKGNIQLMVSDDPEAEPDEQ